MKDARGIQWIVACVLVAVLVIVVPPHNALVAHSDEEFGMYGIVGAEPATPQVIMARQTDFTSFEEVRKVATFPVLAPGRIPEGFSLISLQHVRPDPPEIPASVHNDTVAATYGSGDARFTIMQGYFSGGDVPAGPGEAAAGEIDLIGARAKWVRGTWAERPTGGREWRNEPLQVGWYKNGLGYAILSRDLNLEQLVEIANGLEPI